MVELIANIIFKYAVIVSDFFAPILIGCDDNGLVGAIFYYR